MPVLEFRSVFKSFTPGFIPRRRSVLEDISLTVESGEAFGLLGGNGAGKTTLIKLVVGLLFPDRGEIRIGGELAAQDSARRCVGFLPENPYFYEYLTGAEFLDFHGRLYGLSGELRARRSRELLERLSLGPSANLAIRRYSKGMVQRLGFAQALLAEPTLLVLDEPMSGLDPIGRRDFRDLILEARGRGTTIFFSSHILQDAEVICDRVAILAGGRLLRVGRLDELLAGLSSGYEVGFDGIRGAWEPASARRVSHSADRMLFRTDSLEGAERLGAEARALGGRLVSLVAARATLEELFLREIGSRPSVRS